MAEAERTLDVEVMQPALLARPGLAQLAAVCEASLSYAQRRVAPGGCFFAATALEMGPVPDPSGITKSVLHDDSAALDLARHVVGQRLRLDQGHSAHGS